MKTLLQNKIRWILILLPYTFVGQSNMNLDALKNNFIQSKKSTLDPTIIHKASDAEYEGLAAKSLRQLFTIYKSYFSSQDVNSCNFHPSCSEYGLLSVRKFGVIKGGMMTFDRMIRCNPFSLASYTYDPSKKRFIDPIE
ncbi:MAG: membrane protein insertion efficiency factor YidD [Saprospiraceae bacterium]|nr:membrane protein insertion efficiency factor YidD [Saprospiraceae bacterium]